MAPNMRVVFSKRGDDKIPTETLKTYVVMNLKAAKDIKVSQETRQYLIAQACRYELELVRRGMAGELPIATSLTQEQQDDMLQLYMNLGTKPNMEVLPDEDSEEAPPPSRVEMEENIFHYECGCVYNLTLKRWDTHCPLFADGRCPVASPQIKDNTQACGCVWPAHCSKCAAEYVAWWRTQVATELLLGVGKRGDQLVNERADLQSDENALTTFEDEGGSLAIREALAESDRRVVARTAEAAKIERDKSGLYAG